MKKRPCIREQQQPDSQNVAEEINPEKQAHEPQTPSSEKTKQDSGCQIEKPGDTPQRILTNHTWTHSLPSTQTVVVSPLSRTDGPRSRPLPPEGSDREANMQRLAGLEKEAQSLRRLLGLEITKTTQGTMTEKAASAASREVSCQTDVAEVSRVYYQKLKTANEIIFIVSEAV